MWQTAYKTIYSNTSLAEYLQQASEFSQANKVFTANDMYLGELTGALEAMNVGTTTVLDHAHGSFSDKIVDAVVNASFDSGLRLFHGFAIHELNNGYSLDQQMAKLRSMSKDARFYTSDGRVRLGLAYDRFTLASRQEIDRVWAIAREGNISVVTMHWVGGPYGFGNSPTLANDLGWLNTSTPLVFAHANYPSPLDAYLLRGTDQYIAATPESEMHFALPHEDSHLYLDQASIGVDCHFTFSASMVQQGRMWLQNVRYRNYLDVLNQWEVPVNNPMSVQQAFLLITRNGGLALQRPDLGVIQQGAQADIVVWRTDSPSMLGWRDPIAAIMLHSNVGDIEDVLIGGDFVKRSGRLVYADYEGIRSRFLASAKKIQGIWENSSWPTIEGDNEIGAMYSSTRQVDVLRGNGTGY